MARPVKLAEYEKLEYERLSLIPQPYNEWVDRALYNHREGYVNDTFLKVLVEMTLWKAEWDRNIRYERIKRTFDIAFSLISILILSPIMVACAIAIKLDSPGPVFFRQLRTGKFGQPFWILKFRTMPVSTNSSLRFLKPMEKPKETGVTTRVGDFLRDHKLDELPQLWNCLVGDMSIVGPRPLSMNDSSVTFPRYYRRFAVKPGLTGLWQATVANDVSGDRKLTLDTIYVRKRSFSLDAYLIFRTFSVVILGENKFTKKKLKKSSVALVSPSDKKKA